MKGIGTRLGSNLAIASTIEVNGVHFANRMKSFTCGMCSEHETLVSRD